MGAARLFAPACVLAQVATDPAGPAGWTVRNWLGLVCQVAVFMLLVWFIFWLADLGRTEAERPAAMPPPPAPPRPDGAAPDAPPPAST